MTQVRITEAPKSAMQSGRGKTHRWILEVLSNDPVMREEILGWVKGPNTESQVVLKFESQEAALTYAESQGWMVTTCSQNSPLPKTPKSYADNFKFSRRR